MAPALQITIPTTSIARPQDNKPFTLYHVHLTLPVRTHQVQRRYTDFLNLHKALTSDTGAAPPAPLPPKSWIRRTFNNEKLTEERRKGLERYLKSVIESDDARWRSSTDWRTFLNLPSATNTSGADGAPSSAKRPASGGGGGVRDPNEWLDVHRTLKSQIQSARSQLKQREAATVPQQQHGLSADAKASLVRAATLITQLEDGLRSIADASKGDEAGWGGSQKLGAGEIRRRKDLIGAAKKEVEGLEGLLRSMVMRTISTNSVETSAAASAGDKEALWKGTSAAAKPSGRVLGGPLKETERTRERDNEGVLQLQKQIMQEQDEDVMEIGKTVAKLKDMGIMINEELEVQNQMLGLVEHDTDRLQGKIDVARERMKKIK